MTLIVCADDDVKTKGNPGLTKATAAALAVGGKLAVPDFGDNRPDGATDFNDMAAHCGVEAVARAIAGAIHVTSSARDVGEHLTPKSLCSRELGVTCSPDEDEDRKPVRLFAGAIPRGCMVGPIWPLARHRRTLHRSSVRVFMVVVSVNVGLMLGRSVWIESPQPLYPNFYVLLLGQTGDARKSTCLWLAGQLLKQLGDDDVEIIKGIVSTEGLFERLAKKEDTRALGYVDEFRSLLSVGQRQGTRDLLPKLNSLILLPG